MPQAAVPQEGIVLTFAPFKSMLFFANKQQCMQLVLTDQPQIFLTPAARIPRCTSTYTELLVE